MGIEIFIAAGSIMLVSLTGAVFTWSVFGKWVVRNLHYLISFSAGVFFIVALGLAKEVLEGEALLKAVFFIAGGAFVFFLFDRFIPDSHHHHEPHRKDHTHSKRGGLRIMLADGLHNVADGLILVPAFAVSLEVGVAVTIGILIHEAIQEISEFFVLKEAGHSTAGALIRNFIVSATILIGVFIGIAVSDWQWIEKMILGVASGGFIYVVFVDLLPHSMKVCHGKWCVLKHVAWAIIGAIVMVGINFLV